MSLSIIMSAFYVQAAGAAYDVYMASLTELDSKGVTGEVTIFVTPTGLLGIGSAAGLEADLTAATDCTAKNGCGVHVHSGTACTSSTTQGGHYYEGTSDPWATIRYPSTSSIGASTFSFSVTTAAQDIANKTFVVHNKMGDRVACGILEKSTGAQSATLQALSGSGVTGDVTIVTSATRIIGAGEAIGLEASLNDDSNGGSDCTKTNGCGVHVHSGTACTSSTTQGGHYHESGTSDPWAKIRYPTTSSAGAATFSFAVTTAARDIANKTFIVHNNAGGRVACGLLGSTDTPRAIISIATKLKFSALVVMFAGMTSMAAGP